MNEKNRRQSKTDYISILVTRHDGQMSCRCILKFLVLTLGIFVFFLGNGFITEDLFRIQGFRHFGWFLTLIQLLTYFTLSTLDLLRQGRFTKCSSVPVGFYLLLSVLTIGSTGLSNVSVGYLNYPTQLIFKSCKIVPVMIGGVILLGKRYSVMSYAAACCMSVGLIIFCFPDANVSPNFEIKDEYADVVLVCISLIGDAAIGNTEEKMLKVCNVPNNEMLFYTSSIGSFIILTGLVVTGQFQGAVQFCNQNSSHYIYCSSVRVFWSEPYTHNGQVFWGRCLILCDNLPQSYDSLPVLHNFCQTVFFRIRLVRLSCTTWNIFECVCVSQVGNTATGQWGTVFLEDCVY